MDIRSFKVKFFGNLLGFYESKKVIQDEEIRYMYSEYEKKYQALKKKYEEMKNANSEDKSSLENFMKEVVSEWHQATKERDNSFKSATNDAPLFEELLKNYLVLYNRLYGLSASLQTSNNQNIKPQSAKDTAEKHSIEVESPDDVVIIFETEYPVLPRFNGVPPTNTSETNSQEFLQSMNPDFKRREPEESAKAKALLGMSSRFLNWASRQKQRFQGPKSEMSSSVPGVEMTSVQGKKTTASGSGDTGTAVQRRASSATENVQVTKEEEISEGVHYLNMTGLEDEFRRRDAERSRSAPPPQPASSRVASGFTARLKALDQASTGASMSGPPPNPNESVRPATTTTGIPLPKATGPRSRAPTQFEPQEAEKQTEKPADDKPKGNAPK